MSNPWTKDYTHPERTFRSMDSAVGYFHARGFTQGSGMGPTVRTMWHADGRRVTITNVDGKITAEEKR